MSVEKSSQLWQIKTNKKNRKEVIRVKEHEVNSLMELEEIAEKAVDFSGSFSRAAVFNSICDCSDSDGCDGDCGCDEP